MDDEKRLELFKQFGGKVTIQKCLDLVYKKGGRESFTLRLCNLRSKHGFETELPLGEWEWEYGECPGREEIVGFLLGLLEEDES